MRLACARWSVAPIQPVGLDAADRSATLYLEKALSLALVFPWAAVLSFQNVTTVPPPVNKGCPLDAPLQKAAPSAAFTRENLQYQKDRITAQQPSYVGILNRKRPCQPPQSAIDVESGRGLVSRALPVHTASRNCMRDEGRSFGFGNQVLIPSHRKLLRSKAMVVSIAETSGR